VRLALANKAPAWTDKEDLCLLTQVITVFPCWSVLSDLQAKRVYSSAGQHGKAVIAFKELAMLKGLQNCGDCGVKPGHIHQDNCDIEICSVCGGQRLGCHCAGHDKAFARWTGIWPGKTEADFLGIDLNEFDRLGYGRIFFVKPRGK
jgi:hypothetical protein